MREARNSNPLLSLKCLYPLLSIIAVFLFPLYSIAQNNTRNLSINVSTNVISTIEIVTLKSMDLTNAERSNEIIRIDPISSSNAGKMVAMGNANSDIRITYQQRRELTHQDSPSSLIFNYRVAGNNEDDQASAELLESDNRDFELNGDGQFFLWIGGSIDVSTAAPGNYQGEFTLDIEYI